ncbi:hypothetical protein AFERRI_50020 [Acidithiobacillus ferrivorans]|uniref:Uncharacterized protein n=1 Tax=Acidithiobacillus ferrivorans TaxID=160808 RepID=A0A060URM4_9PROT|nr:hypothetical protein AFERRI_50020 [Acidithiobacillus ferrivorans]
MVDDLQFVWKMSPCYKKMPYGVKLSPMTAYDTVQESKPVRRSFIWCRRARRSSAGR